VGRVFHGRAVRLDPFTGHRGPNDTGPNAARVVTFLSRALPARIPASPDGPLAGYKLRSRPRSPLSPPMTTSLRAPGLLLAILCAVASGCDPQAGASYRGEPLFSVTGSVRLTRSRVEGPLVPAIAFVDGDDALWFLDVEVEGEFPSGFTLRVYDPPPSEVLVALESDDASSVREPRAAVGFITAVAKNHPARVQTGVPVSGFSACTADDVCRAEETWCKGNGDECYFETTVCEDASSQTPDCTTESTGSKELKRDVFSQFEGLALTHRILYLESPAPVGSESAAEAASPEGLAAGYHLFHVETAETASRQAQLDAFDACQNAIRSRAVELYNREQDSSLAFEAVYGCDRAEDCDGGRACADACEPSVSEEVYEAVRALEDRAALDVTCASANSIVMRIPNPLAAPISLVIGPNLTPE